MNTLRKAKTVSLHIALLGSFLTFGTQLKAQEAVAATDSFEYYICDQKLPPTDIKGIFNAITIATEVYNNQSSVDVKMAEPDIGQCYIQLGLAGSMFAGASSVTFFTSSSHFRCSLDGNCVGDLAGYDASALPTKNGIQLVANTNRVDDIVYLCFRNGDFDTGRC
jgi:hypothetical protein